MVATVETPTTVNLQHQVGKFVLYEGRLGHVMGAGLVQGAEPKRWVNLRVMDRPICNALEQELIGLRATDHVYVGLGRYIRVPDLWTWPVVTIEQDVPAPPNGKGYTWEWTGASYGHRAYVRDGWHRRDYATCHECYPTWREINGKRRNYDNVHPPTWSPADCGRCHPNGVCNGKGVCEEVAI